jgi:hypothetical protein
MRIKENAISGASLKVEDFSSGGGGGGGGGDHPYYCSSSILWIEALWLKFGFSFWSLSIFKLWRILYLFNSDAVCFVGVVS